MRNWLLKLKCDVKKQNHPTVSQNFEENEKSTKRFLGECYFRVWPNLQNNNLLECLRVLSKPMHQ